jgi:diguanylate cyclase (GGDEF)-like protein/PAS domain S-box-containing protein
LALEPEENHRRPGRFAASLARAAPYLGVALIALAALGASLTLREREASARSEQLLVVRLQAAVREQAVLQEDALHAGELDAGTSAAWTRARDETRALRRELASGDADGYPLLTPLERSLAAYERGLRASFDALVRTGPDAARRIHTRRVDPPLVRSSRLLAAYDRDNDEEAAAADAAATAGSALAFAIAALLIGILLWRVQRGKSRSAAVAAEEAVLRRSERRFRALVENASDMILVVDRNGVVTVASDAVDQQLGRSADAIVGAKLVDLVHPEDVQLVVPLLAEAVDHRPGLASVEWRMARADGSFAHVDTKARDLTEDESVGGLVLTVRDISERKAFEDQLRHRAFHDPLTHLPNRALFDDRVAHAFSRRSASDRHVAVLFIDLDDFKGVNDALGHAAGDQLLIGVASRLRSCLRSSDTAARLGGDEFGVLLEGLDHPSEAAGAADRVLQALRAPFFMHGQPARVKASVGVAVGSGGTTKAEQLVRDADVAMYLAKHNGRDRYEVYDPSAQQHLLERLEITGDERTDGVTWFLRSEEQRAEIEALLDDEHSLTSVFQPIVDVGTGDVIGYEALTRFPGDSGRPPNAWFAQAHRCGLGVQLEMHALRAALRVPGRPEGTFLTVNLSPSAVVSGEIDRTLPDDLSAMVIEIVETELIAEGSRLELALERLRARGARVAVDDTGSGYAGLKQLMRLRPEVIKLDRSLVDGLSADLAKRALVESLVRYARRIDAGVCAEGVETLADLQTLADIDIETAQGYVLARPSAPWAEVDPVAAETCASSMSAALAGADAASAGGSDQRLASVSRAILEASWAADLRPAVELIAAELGANRVSVQRLSSDGAWLETVAASRVDTAGERFSLADYPTAAGVVRERRAARLRVADPAAEPATAAALGRRGLGSLLLVPVIYSDRVTGVLSVASGSEYSWTRSQIHRGWLFAYELGAALDAFERGRPEPRPRTPEGDVYRRSGDVAQLLRFSE